MADLKSVLRLFARSYFGGDVHIRFRPSFFPFTEPSVEVDMSWHGGWIEMGGAGMVDPNVLRGRRLRPRGSAPASPSAWASSASAPAATASPTSASSTRTT